jgi:hypothetical protein
MTSNTNWTKVHDALSESQNTFNSDVLFNNDIRVEGTMNAAGDTSSGDNAAIGYTITEGLILTGQGSTSDVTIKNDADVTVLSIATGSTDVVVEGNISSKRLVQSIIAQTAATTLTTDQSGSLIVLAGTPSQIQVINLPTIPSTNEVGTYYDFVITVIGNSGAAGSYTINTGGHASDLTAAPTAGYDDFIGTLKVVDNVAVTTADKSNVVPASGEGTLVLADDTTNAVVAVGSSFRVTAVTPSTTTASTNVWLLEGTLMTAQATGFVTTNLFTAP